MRDRKNRCLLILGDPAAQVMAPKTFNPIFAATGTDPVSIQIEVAPEYVQEFVTPASSTSNLVTLPHKEQPTDVLDHCGVFGTLAGPLNAIRHQPDGSLDRDLYRREPARGSQQRHAAVRCIVPRRPSSLDRYCDEKPTQPGVAGTGPAVRDGMRDAGSTIAPVAGFFWFH